MKITNSPEINQARHREKIAESMKRNIQIEKAEPKVPNVLTQMHGRNLLSNVDEGQSGSIVNKFTHK